MIFGMQMPRPGDAARERLARIAEKMAGDGVKRSSMLGRCPTGG
jgi:hypothetical protein